MLTCLDQLRDEEAGLAAGADEYVTKPFSTTVLTGSVARLVARPGMAGDA